MANRSIIVHNSDHARAAVSAAGELDVPVTLRSAPSAAAYLGAAVFRHMIAQAMEAHPDVAVTAILDCGGDAGRALGALRQGIRVVRLDASEEVRDKVADIAALSGACLEENEGEDKALDLLDHSDPLAACRRWLGGEQ